MPFRSLCCLRHDSRPTSLTAGTRISIARSLRTTEVGQIKTIQVGQVRLAYGTQAAPICFKTASQKQPDGKYVTVIPNVSSKAMLAWLIYSLGVLEFEWIRRF
jgi:hypothetical protein